MDEKDYSSASFKILKKVKSDLEQIEMLSSISEIKANVRTLLQYIGDETVNNKDSFEKLLLSKVHSTHAINPELHSHLYILYRNLNENNITVSEAKMLYDMYIEEYEGL